MANNRMYLCCERCAENPDTTVEACLFFFAKYYPSSGWSSRVAMEPTLDTWFTQHRHGDMYGESIRLLYEWQFDDAALSKRSILERLATAMK